MTQYAVHTVPGSPFARAVIAMLEEKHADWDLRPLQPATLRGPEHLTLHPFGRMPALSWDGNLLYETQAILRFLDETLPGASFTPATAEGRARMNQLIGINDWYLFPESARIVVFQRIVGPTFIPGFETDVSAVEAALPRSQAIFAELARLLGDAPWFGGEEPSLADLMIGPQLELFSRTPEWAPLVEGRAALACWLERIEARPAMRATLWQQPSQKIAASG